MRLYHHYKKAVDAFENAIIDKAEILVASNAWKPWCKEAMEKMPNLKLEARGRGFERACAACGRSHAATWVMTLYGLDTRSKELYINRNPSLESANPNELEERETEPKQTKVDIGSYVAAPLPPPAALVRFFVY